MNSLGLYIHIPYCLHKCGYCDFNSHPIQREEMDSYVEAIFLEMAHYAARFPSKPRLASIFLGGGTPTTLPAVSLENILSQCARHFPLAPDCEITLEANPATIEVGTLKKLRAAGYNRISIGVQSFDENELRRLDRVHGVDEIHTTVDRAREAGFDNLSMDLMFGLPDQTPARWEDHLNQALAKNPEHLSTYNLTVEPGTAFFKQQERGKLQLPPEETQLQLYRKTIEVLEAAGYSHYEISNFCRPGRECRHNLTYWQNGETLGLGAGASSFLNGVRFKNFNPPARYIREVRQRGTAVEFSETLPPRRAMGETLMLGLRLLQGIPIPAFEKRFRTSFESVYGKVVSALQEKDLIHKDRDRIALTRKGLFLADSVILEFIA